MTIYKLTENKALPKSLYFTSKTKLLSYLRAVKNKDFVAVSIPNPDRPWEPRSYDEEYHSDKMRTFRRGKWDTDTITIYFERNVNNGHCWDAYTIERIEVI